MKSPIRKSIVFILLLMVFSCSAIAQEVEQTAASDDFRIAVHTNKNVYHNRQILRLTVQLLNNSPEPAHIIHPEQPVLDPQNGENEIEEIFEGTMDGADVDVIIAPRRHIVIGYAELIPLGLRPAIEPNAVEPDESLPLKKRFRLPLFGNHTIPGHSTRIISIANILLAHPPILDPNAVEPVELDPNQILDSQPVELIQAAGRYIAPRPGYYLLNCYINRIAGARIAQAQKIIRIKHRRITPVVRQLKENNRILKRIDRRTEKGAETGKKTLSQTRLNGRALRYILMYLFGRDR